MQNNIKYANAQYFATPGLDLKDLKMEEDWSGRPASKWSVQKIGQLQARIDKFSHSIYHSKWYGKRNLSNLIPGHVLRQYANEVFGYDGWRMDLQYVDVHESSRPGLPMKHNVLAEAQVKITLKDGTNLQAAGIGCATMTSKGECYGKAKKQAVNDAFKKAILGFEQVILAHEIRVENGYYVDGLYSSKVAKENRC